MIKIILVFFFFFSQIVLSQNDEFQTRVSFLNFGFDFTKYSSFDESYRSISVIPFMIEKDNLELGLYLTPFIKEEYDDFGNYQYSNLLDSYLLNLRIRYIYPIYGKIESFIDWAYCDGNAYNWKDISILWIEAGFYYRLNYSTKLFAGYKHTLETNENIDLNGFFVNLIFGYSFLKRK